MKKILKNNFELKQSDLLIILFSILGLIPFIGGMIDLWYNYPNLKFIINIPKNYGVIIFTFLGSIYWGIIIESNKRNYFSNKLEFFTIVWSIIPATCGILILTIEHNISILILSIGFVIVHIVDEIYNNILSFPKWYMLLRRSLSTIVVIILICSYLIITKL